MLERQLGQPLEEGKRRNRSGRVVGVVHPEESDPLPGLRLHRVDVGEEAVRFGQRQPHHLGAGETSAARRNRVSRIGDQHQVFRRSQVDDLRERIDRLLAAVGRHHLVLRVDRDAEALVAPLRDRAPELE